MVTKRLTLDELIDREARKLALEYWIEFNSWPTDKSLPDDIVLQLETVLTTSDEFHIRAKKNVLAEKDAHDEVLRSIGLDPIEVDPLELDL